MADLLIYWLDSTKQVNLLLFQQAAEVKQNKQVSRTVIRRL